MIPDHDYYTIGINPSPGDGEIVVLFSGEGRPQGLHSIGPAVHDYYLIHTVLSGKGRFVIRDKHYVCTAGDTFIIFPGELFFYEADELRPWHYVWVAFAGHQAASIIASIGASPDNPVIRNSLNLNVKNDYQQLHDCFQSPAAPELANLEAGGWVRLLLKHFAEANLYQQEAAAPSDSETERLMKQAIQYLTLQFTQPISIEQMSHMLGYHRTHLSKLFKQFTGLSPMQYLLRIRMERADCFSPPP